MARYFHMPTVFAVSSAFALMLGCAEPAGVASDPVQESSSLPPSEPSTVPTASVPW